MIFCKWNELPVVALDYKIALKYKSHVLLNKIKTSMISSGIIKIKKGASSNENRELLW